MMDAFCAIDRRIRGRNEKYPVKSAKTIINSGRNLLILFGIFGNIKTLN